MENTLEVENVWFADGLRFQCTGCGKCCTGSPGYVFLSHLDLDRLATHFAMSSEEFCKTYTHRVDEKLSLLERPGSDHCIFLKNNQCSVYDARPQQCRTFPWWVYFLRDEESWNDAANRCEGINHPDAPIVPALRIQEQCLTYLDNLLDQNFDES